MFLESTRLSVAGLAIAVFSFAAPARAQQATHSSVYADNVVLTTV